MKRAYYSNNTINFLKDSRDEILGCIARNNEFELNESQKRAWLRQIDILKDTLKDLEEGFILFEYTIPRMGKRIDNILIYRGIIYLLEFKVGSSTYNSKDIDQVFDYALDLKSFHEQSHNKILVPILVATDAKDIDNELFKYEDNVFKPLCCNKDNLIDIILRVSNLYLREEINPSLWMNSRYRPTPTIIEAAQALYKNHNVEDISRSDAGAKNLTQTTEYINEVIEDSKRDNKKTICFLTGVPGAGKTLAGLNIANSRQKYKEEEHAVFLSGNGPLVSVLREALARDDNKNNNTNMEEARRKSSMFIQNIHHFRDEALRSENAPTEKVVIFDEAQRAWNKEKTISKMKDKYPDFNNSEPDFLISIMDRHKGWAVIVCLIGGGQEIHNGEAGLKEWFYALDKFKDWEVHLSDRITESEYLELNNLSEVDLGLKHKFTSKLHLGVSLRSFRSENVSDLVKSILDLNIEKSKTIYDDLKENYPIYITRDIDKAKSWLRSNSKGTRRCGIIASSGARRLKGIGIDVKAKIEASHWFLGSKDDVRSSYYLEDIATEFDIQGLELDWTCVAWGRDFRYIDGSWEYKQFRGSKWQNINQESEKLYRKNTYRVLLTRARQGMIIFVPKGDKDDHTRLPEYYDGTYKYLKSIGFKSLD